MSIRQRLHYRLRAATLANWLHNQPAISWWSVDGDPVLTERMSFPCPADDLSEQIRRANGTLLLRASKPLPNKANGAEIESADLDALAFVDRSSDRVFELCWENANPETDWLLAEDREAGASSSSSSSSSAEA